MRRVIYSSTGRAEHLACDLNDILAAARRNNPELGVTGMLLTQGLSYVQILEGPAENLMPLVRYIAGDRRHSGFRLLLDQQVAVPLFIGWSLAHHTTTSIGAELARLIEASRGCDAPEPAVTRALLDGLLALGRAARLAR